VRFTNYVRERTYLRRSHSWFGQMGQNVFFFYIYNFLDRLKGPPFWH